MEGKNSSDKFNQRTGYTYDNFVECFFFFPSRQSESYSFIDRDDCILAFFAFLSLDHLIVFRFFLTCLIFSFSVFLLLPGVRMTDGRTDTTEKEEVTFTH